MRTIHAVPITEANIRAVFALEPKKDQRDFVASPMKSLAYCSLYPETATPYALMHHDVLVGYFAIIYDPTEAAYVLWHFLIDQAFQGQGFGKAGLIAALTEISKKAHRLTNRVLLTVEPENTLAQQLYQTAGFTDTKRIDDDGEFIFEWMIPEKE